MQDKLNEDMFDAVLQRAFCDYADEKLAEYPDCETLAKKYPLPKKEKRAFDRAAKQVKYHKSLARVYLSRAAVVLLCIIALAAGLMMTNPTVRAAAKNVFLEWFDKYTLFTFVKTDTDYGDFESVDEVKVGYIPVGYELVNTISIPKSVSYEYSLNNSDDDNFFVDIFENGVTDLFPDNERSQYTKTRINGHETWIIYDENVSSGSLILVGAKISVLIDGNLPKEELIKIAESIK